MLSNLLAKRVGPLKNILPTPLSVLPPSQNRKTQFKTTLIQYRYALSIKLLLYGVQEFKPQIKQ